MSVALTSFVAAPPAIYLLAEHLDAVLAAGEDLVALEPPAALTGRLEGERLADHLAAEAAFTGLIAALEAALLSRVLQARVRATEVARFDPRFRSIVGLFLAGTETCRSAIDRHGPRSRAARGPDDAGDRVAFLAERALLEPDMALAQAIRPHGAFRVAGVIQLDPLLDLVATFLTTLEIHYQLFEASDATVPADPALEVSDDDLTGSPQSDATLVTTAEDEVRVL